MAQLKIKFNFTHCMVEGCDYDKCFEIHRFIPGKNGGQYIIGNMFAICPNHHSEEHRKICVFTKISDSKLGITYLK
ncbi:MAG: HNH endonuclease signature motif containing protein [Pseudomonadota bacterium]